MKRDTWLILLIVFAFAMSSCSTTATATSQNETGGVQDQASLLAALQSAGVTAEIGDSISQDFFHVEGHLINISENEGFQVFEYKTAEAMESDASPVAPDGGSIGTSMMNWVMPPHFFKSGRILVLYLGNNETTLGLLEKVMGKQFAGQ